MCFQTEIQGRDFAISNYFRKRERIMVEEEGKN